MNKKESISSIQTALLFLVGITGSSIILIPASVTGAARNGAWISFLIAWLAGFLLLLSILYLQKQHPGLTFMEYSRRMVGRPVATIMAILFLLALFWQEAAIVIEVSGFFKSTMMKNTPSPVINAMFFTMAALTARAGIEVMARMFSILALIMFGCVTAVLLLVSVNFHPEFLLPVMPDGIKPILHGAYIAYGFPYAEVVIFSWILQFVRKDEAHRLGRDMCSAFVINGITLLFSIISSIIVLGPLAGDLKYSLYQLARLVFVQEIIERIESVIGLSLIIGSYMKSTIVLFIITRLLSQLSGLSNYRIVIFPTTLICLLLSVTMYANEASFVEDGYVMWPLFNTIAYVVPMLIVLAATWINGRMRK